MIHLAPEELVDAIEGQLAPARRAHFDACEACRRRTAELSSMLDQSRQVVVPEPSPLFWEHFSSRVRDAVSAENAPGGWGLGWRPWPLWRLVVPVAGLAMLVAALVLVVPRPGPPAVELPGGPHGPDTLPGRSEDGWNLVAELVGPLDWETASEAGLGPRPGSAELAVFDLTPEEQLELRRLLDAELRRPKS